MANAVLCGTDFSPLAKESARLARRLADKLDAPLHLVHATDDPTNAMPRLEAQAAELGGSVQTEVLEGLPDEVLVRRAGELQAKLVVVGSLGRRSLKDWLLGSTAERVVRSAPVPTLVIRQPERIEAWLDGQRPLKVLVAVTLDGSSLGALQWLKDLEQVGPVAKQAVQVSGGPNLDAEWLEEETGRLQEYTGLPREECHVEVMMWPVEEHLLTLAERENSDLVVVGTHHRTGLERLWQGSVSMKVVQRCATSVACVPTHRPS